MTPASISSCGSTSTVPPTSAAAPVRGVTLATIVARAIGVLRVEVALVVVRRFGLAIEQLQRRAEVQEDLRAVKAGVRFFEDRERRVVLLLLEQLHAELVELAGVELRRVFLRLR